MEKKKSETNLIKYFFNKYNGERNFWNFHRVEIISILRKVRIENLKDSQWWHPN